MKQFRVRAKKTELPPGSIKQGYEIDHSDQIYLMDPDGKFLDQVDTRLSEHENARNLLAKMVQNEHKRQKLEETVTTT